VNREDTAARQAARSIWSMRAIASIAASRLSTKNPVTPSSISSGIDPRLQAMTGVPQASASTTDRPNGSSKLMRWSSARADPRVFARDSPPTRIEPSCRHDFADLAMMVLPWVLFPGTAVALQEQRLVIGPARRGCFQFPRQCGRDRYGITLSPFRAAVSAAALSGFRHHELRACRMGMQIFNTQPDGLAWACAGDRQRIG